MMRAKEVIKEVVKPGKVYASCLVKNDVIHLSIDKSELLSWLRRQARVGHDVDCGMRYDWVDGVLFVDAS